MTTEQRFEQAYRVLARGLLLRAPGFDRCGATLIDELVASGELARLATGDAVTRRGQRCDHLVLVVEGALEARISVSDGRRHLLAFVLPGLLIGFLSVIDGGPQPHDAVAHLPTIVLKMPCDAVRRLRASAPLLHQAFEVQLAERARRLYAARAENMLFPVRERLARERGRLAASVGVQRDNRWTIGLGLSQADLADLLGAGRQAVNTQLSALQRSGLVRIGREQLDILDLAALGRLVPQGLVGRLGLPPA